MKTKTEPRFNRLRCSECGRVIPWTWLTKEPKKATLDIDEGPPVSRMTATCLEHQSATATIQADGAP